jgi:hypothetical protein
MKEYVNVKINEERVTVKQYQTNMRASEQDASKKANAKCLN